MSTSKLVNQFEKARDDLGIEIIISYEIYLRVDLKIKVPIFVKSFGGNEGTIVVTDFNAIQTYCNELVKLGYGFSTMSEPTNLPVDRYNREDFIEMLSDWGWTGDPERKPSWVIDQKEEDYI